MKKALLLLSFCVVCIFAGISIGNSNALTYADGKLYMSDIYNHVIYVIDKKTGKASVFAGRPGKAGSADGIKKTAQFNSPGGITSDGKNLYVSDTLNHTIRVINAMTGKVSTLAGLAGKPGLADGTGSAARFNNPNGILYDDGNLYVVDSENHTVRKVEIATGNAITCAGKAALAGSADGKGESAKFNFPSGIATDGNYLYVTDTHNYIIRKIDKKTGEVSTFAGTAGQQGTTDDIGAAAEFNKPRGITFCSGNIYVLDSRNNTIRKIDIASGRVTTFAGEPMSMGYSDGTGAAARFSQPLNIVGDDENLYITQTGSTIIRKVVISTRVVTSMPEIR